MSWVTTWNINELFKKIFKEKRHFLYVILEKNRTIFKDCILMVTENL